MRLAAFALLLGVGACDSGRILPVSVLWMDWPAEVGADDPFRTRLVVWQPCALIRGFVPAPMADASGVTFAPYFVVDKQEVACLSGVVASEVFVTWAIDTAGMAPGLPADVARVYEMRGAGVESCPACLGFNTAPSPVTFGEVVVRPTQMPATVVRNAAGAVLAQRDSTGCLRIQPSGLPGPGRALVVENPPDTTSQWYRFVRGYIYEPAAPVCGETKVFHLTGQYTGG